MAYKLRVCLSLRFYGERLLHRFDSAPNKFTLLNLALYMYERENSTIITINKFIEFDRFMTIIFSIKEVRNHSRIMFSHTIKHSLVRRTIDDLQFSGITENLLMAYLVVADLNSYVHTKPNHRW